VSNPADLQLADPAPSRRRQRNDLWIPKNNATMVEFQPKKYRHLIYPLVNIQKTMENHHVQWVNPLQMAIFNN
jgi:hypothetical protein